MTSKETRIYLKENWEKPIETLMEVTGKSRANLNYYARQLGLPYRKRRLKEDVVGMRFGRLVVLERVNVDKVKVKCDCGTIFETWLISLRNGDTRSCGCLRRERLKQYYERNNHDKSGN